MKYTRRSVLAGLGLAGLGAVMPPLVRKAGACSLSDPLTGATTRPFRLAVINDEITQDFEKACQIVAGDFGLHWIELRSMWNKNVTELDAKEVEDARKILEKHKLRVTDIASPLFKTDWPGAPQSSQSERRDQFHANFDAAAQDKLLERCISLAKAFNTDRIRCFDYWRLDDQKPYRAAINAKLLQAAERCAKDNLILLLENEMSCNTATGEEAATVLKAIPTKNLMLNWYPGNSAVIGKTPYPTGYQLLPNLYWALPLQRCSAHDERYNETKRDGHIRLGPGRWRHCRLGWAAPGSAASRLPLRPEPRNPLARRRYARTTSSRVSAWTGSRKC